MRPDCVFRNFPFVWRKVYIISRFANICGRTCYIMYYTSFRRKKYPFIGSFVSFYGTHYKLRGTVINLWDKRICNLSDFGLPQIIED